MQWHKRPNVGPVFLKMAMDCDCPRFSDLGLTEFMRMDLSRMVGLDGQAQCTRGYAGCGQGNAYVLTAPDWSAGLGPVDPGGGAQGPQEGCHGGAGTV